MDDVILRPAWVQLVSSPSADLLDQFVELINECSPIGLSVDLYMPMVTLKVLEANLLGRVLSHLKQSGVPLDSRFLLIQRHFDVSLTKLLGDADNFKLLIQHELDLGCRFSKTKNLLQHVMTTVPTVEVFKMIFETKLVKNNTLTALEFAQSLRPDVFFFFWEPLFHVILSSNSVRNNMTRVPS